MDVGIKDTVYCWSSGSGLCSDIRTTSRVRLLQVFLLIPNVSGVDSRLI